MPMFDDLKSTVSCREDEEEKQAEALAHPVAKTLLESRTIILGSEVEPKLAQRVMSELLYLEAKDPETPITVYINSPGGEISSGLAIYDMIRHVRPPVNCVCAGLTASIATIILVAAEKGRRKALPNARILIPQPLRGFRGAATEIEIHAKEMLMTKKHVNQILDDATGHDLARIDEDTNRDYWMSAKEALDYGLIDEILNPDSRD